MVFLPLACKLSTGYVVASWVGHNFSNAFDNEISSSSALNLNFAQQLQHGLLDLLVPQSVDHGVHQGEDHCMENSHHLIKVEFLKGTAIEVDGWAKHDEDDDDVGDACRESFTLSFVGICSHFDQKDPIGNEEKDETHQGGQATVEEHDVFQGISVSASQLDELSDITEEIVQFIGSTEWQGENKNYLDDRMHESYTPGCQDQNVAHCFADEAGIAQRVANGHIAINGHANEKDNLRAS